MLLENKIPEFLKNHIILTNIESIDEISIFSTKNKNEIIQNQKLKILINLEKVNNVIRINKFHEQANLQLKHNGIYVSCVETMNQRYARKEKKMIVGFKTIINILDFVYKRMLPKIPILKNFYFFITSGQSRVISKAEMLGRLISCGFKIEKLIFHNDLLYIVSKKVSMPSFDMNPSYGLLFKMKRVGYMKKIIYVYKMRTMHPYSEYCQEYIINKNKLAESGKVHNDFRITYWGKFFRKYWIDELPMIINFLKGDLNLVGVRPLSQNYFLRYPKDLQELRVKFKPGLIPPFYADLPSNFDQILLSERKYLEYKILHPYKADLIYFFKAIKNIILKGARSN